MLFLMFLVFGCCGRICRKLAVGTPPLNSELKFFVVLQFLVFSFQLLVLQLLAFSF